MSEITFQLKTEYIELNTLLKITRLCDTGGQANIYIVNGEVLVDGKVEMRKGCKIRRGQKVQLADKTIIVQ